MWWQQTPFFADRYCGASSSITGTGDAPAASLVALDRGFVGLGVTSGGTQRERLCGHRPIHGEADGRRLL